MFNKGNFLIKNTLTFISIIVLLTFGCSKKSLDQPEANPGLEEAHQHEHISLTPEAIKLAGIKILELTEKRIRPEFTVPGEVIINPRTFYRLATRVSGRVEELLVYQGDKVRKGQVVARLFSLAYLESLTELRLAQDRLNRLEKLQSKELASARAIVESVKEKLRILGLNDSDIDSLMEKTSAQNLYAVISPADGQILTSKVYPGDSLEAGAELMEIASFDQVWVEVSVQEKDLGLVKLGQEAIIRASAYPGTEISGRVTFVSPLLETTTRTLKARVEVPNYSGHLKPGMYIEASLLLDEELILAVPEEAVQEINSQTMVFVPEKPGTFTTRQVETGSPVCGWVPVLSGISAGEKYVAEGAFMLKSELLKHTLSQDGHHHD